MFLLWKPKCRYNWIVIKIRMTEDDFEDYLPLSQAESIECKNEMDPFPKLIDLIFTEQMYLNWNIHIVQNSWQVCF